MRSVAWTATLFAAGLAMTSTAAEPASPDDPEPISYVLRFPHPASHYVEVEATFPAADLDELELMMPVWTPGSYLVREYARHVEDLRATSPDGASLPVRKSRKNRWAIRPAGAPRVVVNYRVYGREMAVQTNWIDDAFAMLNGAPTFITRVGDAPRPHEVRVDLPPGWLLTATGLPAAPGGAPHHYRAADYDELVDCPLYAGNAEVLRFEVDGKPHELVLEGGGGVWDGPRSASDVQAIVREQSKFWGGLPYDKYVFFNILSETGGGLEHRNSTVLMGSRWSTRTRKSYLGWLFLVSHEFFHTWNVKRLRPAALGPFDYEAEVYTPDLWVAEGLTSYYERLFVRRAGLCTADEFLEGDPPRRGQTKSEHEIEQLQNTPGRLVQPVDQASLDAWIKFYRRDENTPNTAISYYVKGAVLGFLLDAHIRKLTDGKKSLDDVLRAAYPRYSGDKGYTPDEFRQVASEVAGSDLAGWFDHALTSTDELDYSEALAWFGLRFQPPKRDEKDPPKAWLGLETKNQSGQLLVDVVKRGTPGLDAGFQVGDEILAIGDDRVTADQWSGRLEHYRPNERVSILISRRGRLRTLETTFAEEPARTWILEIDPDASDPARQHFRAWLNLPDESASQPPAEAGP